MTYNKVFKKVFILSAVLLMLLIISNPDQSQAAAPKSLEIYVIGDITGPYAPITGASSIAVTQDFGEFMAKRGGIKGVPIEMKLLDTRNTRDKALSFYMDVSAKKPALIHISQSADAEVLKERLAEDKIAAIAYSPTPKVQWPKGWIFQTLPEYADQYGLFIDWLVKDWDFKGKGRGPKVALINPDYPYGHTITTKEAAAYAKEKGVEIVASEFFPPFDIDATTQITRIAATNPDWVFGMTIAGQVRVVLKGMETVGLLGKAKVGMGCWAMDPGAARVAGGLMEGVVGVQPYWVPSDKDKVPIVKEILEIFAKNKRPPEQMTEAYWAFWTGMALSVEVITKVVEKDGWDKLTGPTVYKALEESQDLKAFGLLPYKIALGKRSPLYARMAKIQGLDVVPISDWLPVPDVRPYEFREKK